MDNDVVNIPDASIAMTEVDRFRAVAGLLATAILRLHRRAALGPAEAEEFAASSKNELESTAA